MKKILVVDDDTDMLNLVDILLTHHHFVVKTISRWQIISKTIKSFIPDLILMDIDLGGADGGEICKELKRSKETQQLPVILFSALMPEDYLTVCDAQGFLSKPFQASNLIKIIKHNLN